jgi:hypothetical protein
VETGATVCSTGKISRIVSTLEGVPDIEEGVHKSRTTDIVRQELASLASKTRDDKLREGGDGAEDRYNSGDESIAAGMRSEFRRRALGTYVKDLGMSPSVIEPILSVYEESF